MSHATPLLLNFLAEYRFMADYGLLLVAVIAAIVGWFQVQEARTLRRDQARPYVVGYLEIGRGSLVNIVIANLGATAAENVRVRLDEIIERHKFTEPYHLVGFPDPLPILPPGQRWDTFFDNIIERGKSGLPSRYRGEISYEWRVGRKCEQLSTPIDLDLSVFIPRLYADTKDMTDAVGELAKIRKVLSRAWQD